MNTAQRLSVLTATFCLAFASTAANTAMEVAIAVPQRMGGQRALEYSERNPHFHVVLTNTSDQPQRIWRDWCSWGYFALSFELTDSKGKTWTVSKAPKEWDKNFPDFWTLNPHECLVLDVAFADATTWEGFPRPDGVSSVYKMRAIFEIQPDKWSREHSVWTGRVLSKPGEYVFYR